jgi:uncharacterized damage-inducible protein DinB
MKLLLAVAFCALFSVPGSAADESKTSSKYASEFGKHWKVARELTLAVADAMPAESYDFKPNAEEMSFGEQIAHIAGGNYSYCARMTNSKSPFAKPEKTDKETAMKLVGESFDYCSGIVSGLTDDQLSELRGPEGKQASVRELTLGVQTHMAHHRGQAEVYLRVKGVKPPQYKF